MLKRWLEETPNDCTYDIQITGSEIPDLFSNQNVGNSITETVERNNKWIGIVVCSLIAPEFNPSEDLLPFDVLSCHWNTHGSGTGYCDFLPNQITSDYLWLLFLSRHHWDRLGDNRNEVKFTIQTGSDTGYHRFVKVKKCGARALYEHDTEDIISKINQSNNNISIYEATRSDCAYESGDIGNRTNEAATSRSGGSDEEYYSAEE